MKPLAGALIAASLLVSPAFAQVMGLGDQET